MMAASVASNRGLMSRDMSPSPQSLVRAVAEVVREGDWSVAFYTLRQRPEQWCVAWSIVALSPITAISSIIGVDTNTCFT